MSMTAGRGTAREAGGLHGANDDGREKAGLDAVPTTVGRGQDS